MPKQSIGSDNPSGKMHGSDVDINLAAEQNTGNDDFEWFDQLDRATNSIIYDEPQTTSDLSKKAKGSLEDSENSEGNGAKENTDYKSRYAESTREAQRLIEENKRLKKLEQYAPILEALEQDPKLVDHVKSYYEGGGQATKSMKEQLGLSEDFIYDADEAMTDKDSDSAKLLRATISGVVDREVSQKLNAQSKEVKAEMEKQKFMKDHNMNDDQFNELMSWSKSTPLTLESIYALKNMESRQSAETKNAAKLKSNQQKRMKSMPRSLASVPSDLSSNEDLSPEDQLFSKLLQLDKGNNNLFGGRSD